MRFASSLLLVLAAVLCVVVAQAQETKVRATVRGNYGNPGVNGTWTFTLNSTTGLVDVEIVVRGLAAQTYGTHVHTFGDITLGNTPNSPTIPTTANANNSLPGVGAHYNPFGVNHGCLENTTRHVGDLGNIVSTGPEEQTFLLPQLDLLKLSGSGLGNIVGRAVILHSGKDDCVTITNGASGGPLAQGVIGLSFQPAGSTNLAQQELTADPKSAVAVLYTMPNTAAQGITVRGTARFTWNATSGMMRTVLMVSGLAPGSEHGWHLHTYGDDSGLDGTNAGGHYNPTGASHGYPTNISHHAGDLGNFIVDANGVGMVDQEYDLIRLSPQEGNSTNIIGRAVTIHSGRDDGFTPNTGNSGSRMAIGIIGIANTVVPPPAGPGMSSTGGSASSSSGASSSSSGGGVTPTPTPRVNSASVASLSMVGLVAAFLAFFAQRA